MLASLKIFQDKINGAGKKNTKYINPKHNILNIQNEKPAKR